MRKLRSAGVLALLALALAVCATAAGAQTATRTWVSGLGDDSNPCTRTAPCATLAGALARTVASGEIDCLNSGEFYAAGVPTVIAKPITIRFIGVEAAAGAFGSG